jgi:glycosyltransferase involved in cell wall biosynthesis
MTSTPFTNVPAAPLVPSRAPAEGAHVAWLDRACIIVPAYDAEPSLGGVIEALRREIPELAESIIVVDDGSNDATAKVAVAAGVIVVPSEPNAHRDGPRNRGKGAALRAGLAAAAARGMSVALTVDADGQHPADEARRILLAGDAEDTLVLAVRDLVRDGAPRANRFSNGISNYFLSRFAGRTLNDTQCGLRRYPVRETLALMARSDGYEFEAEVLLRAIWNGLDVLEEPVRVLYPVDRRTHFRVSRDVRRIIVTVAGATAENWVRSVRR